MECLHLDSCTGQRSGLDYLNVPFQHYYDYWIFYLIFFYVIPTCELFKGSHKLMNKNMHKFKIISRRVVLKLRAKACLPSWIAGSRVGWRFLNCPLSYSKSSLKINLLNLFWELRVLKRVVLHAEREGGKKGSLN